MKSLSKAMTFAFLLLVAALVSAVSDSELDSSLQELRDAETEAAAKAAYERMTPFEYRNAA